MTLIYAKSQQYNCNIHFHLKSIFKVVMVTNMGWMGKIWQGNPKREAQETWELQRDLLTSAAKVKAHTITTQPLLCTGSPENKDCLPYPNSTQGEGNTTECCRCGTAEQTPQNKPSKMHHWVKITGGNDRRKFKAGNFAVASPPLHSPVFPIPFWHWNTSW